MIVVLRGHRTTDPACFYHRQPRGWLGRLRYDRARGQSCDVCMSARAHFRTESNDSGSNPHDWGHGSGNDSDTTP